MSNATTFMASYATNIAQLVNLLQTLQTQNLQMTDDTTLVTRYFAGTGTLVPRKDIVAADVAAAQAAIVQLLFTFNSGNPTQASALLKMMP